MANNKILFVANLAKEHINKFHIPTIKMLRSQGWIVDVACGGGECVSYCNKQYELPIGRSPFNSNLYKGYKILKKIITEGDYDIVYCHTAVGGLLSRLASRAARKKGTKVIYFAHGTYFYKNAPLKNWIFYPLYKYLSTITDSIITITKEDYFFSRKYFKKTNIYFVHGIGIDVEKFHIINDEQLRSCYRMQLNISQNAIVLIYCAEIIKNKNQKLLIDVLYLLLKEIPNFYLILPGIQHDDGKLEDYARKRGVLNFVRLLGWRNDIAELYNMSDICVASSIREGFGLNLVEAMLCQKPVIASKNSGHASIIQNEYNGFLVELNKPHEFVDAILNVVNNSELRDFLVQNASKEVLKYSSDSILTELENIFNSAVKK